MNDDPDTTSGRTKPAQIPAAPASARDALASAAALENQAPAPAPRAPGPGPATEPTAQPAAGSAESAGAAFSPASGASAPIPAAPVPMPISAPVGRPVGPRPPLITSSHEEEALVRVIRLMDNLSGGATLSPVERALVAGAKTAFEHLAHECDKLLKRKPSDLIPRSAGIAAPPSLKKTRGAATSSDRESRPATKRPRRKSASGKPRQP